MVYPSQDEEGSLGKALDPLKSMIQRMERMVSNDNAICWAANSGKIGRVCAWDRYVESKMKRDVVIR